MRIVALGGGTGLSTLLRGLKEHVSRRGDRWGRRRGEMKHPKSARRIADLAAIVTVTDDGGSSGRLRREYRILPPGDIRNCMVALSADEALLGRLFQYRFHAGRGLRGHSFGNLFLTALTHITGDFNEAVRLSGEVLAIRGRIFPSTIDNVNLEAVLENGGRVLGETRISQSKSRIQRVSLVPRRVRPLPETLEAIARADLILLGPGSLYTSVLPNLLIPQITEAIAKSHATRVYIANLMPCRRVSRAAIVRKAPSRLHATSRNCKNSAFVWCRMTCWRSTASSVTIPGASRACSWKNSSPADESAETIFLWLSRKFPLPACADHSPKYPRLESRPGVRALESCDLASSGNTVS